MRPINAFLLSNNLRIAQNPCISPDFCLDWPSLQSKFADRSAQCLRLHDKSGFPTANTQPSRSTLGVKARLQAISSEARLLYTKGVASYLILLADNTKLVPAARCAAARAQFAARAGCDELLNAIA